MKIRFHTYGTTSVTGASTVGIALVALGARIAGNDRKRSPAGENDGIGGLPEPYPTRLQRAGGSRFLL